MDYGIDPPATIEPYKESDYIIRRKQRSKKKAKRRFAIKNGKVINNQHYGDVDYYLHNVL